MKHLLPFFLPITIGMSLFHLVANGQNLVPNPSFEEYSECPQTVNQIDFATGWSSYRNSVEFLNSCSDDVIVDVPFNQFGNQMPANGEGYAGIFVYSSSEFFREAVGAELITPLQMGNKYNVSFKVNLANSTTYGGCGISNLGIKFLMQSYNPATPIPIDNHAHVYTSSVITDTVNWVTVSGDFVADANYTHFAIGNFFDDQSIDTVRVQPNPEWFSYYYVDDVHIASDTLTSAANHSLPSVSVYPNPASDFVVVEGYSDVNSISIYNAFGQVFQLEQIQLLSSGRVRIAFPPDLPTGYYQLVFNGSERTKSIPLIIN